MRPLDENDPTRIGDYQALAVLGEGGMGRVYLARSAGGRLVALKVVRPELADDGDFRERFRRETKAARRVGGAFTTPVLGADANAPTPWLATVYIPGPQLSEAVTAHGPLPTEGVRALGAALAEALTAVHAAGIVHRDLKPGNVLLAGDGPRLIDFGISRVVDGTALTRTGAFLGTPAYMSPEQLGPSEEIGPASDVFSLGGVLVFAVTGRLPFRPRPDLALPTGIANRAPDLDGVPSTLIPIVAACMEKDPADRPTPHELLQQFAVFGPPPDPADWMPEPLRTDITSRVQEATAYQTGPIRHPQPAPQPTVGQSPISDATVADPTEKHLVPAGQPLSRRRLITVGAGAIAGAGLLGGAAAWALNRPGGRKSPAKDQHGPAPGWIFKPPPRHDDNHTFLLASAGSMVCVAGDGLYGLDAASGKQRWSQFGDDYFVAGGFLGLEGGIAYTNDAANVLHWFDAATGTPLGTADLSKLGLQQYISDSVVRAVRGGVVYLGGQVGSSGPYALIAYDPKAQRSLWTLPTGQNNPDLAIPPSGGPLLVSAAETTFVVDPVSGHLLHSFRVPGSDGRIAALDGVLFLTAGDQMGAYSPTGTRLWSVPQGAKDHSIRCTTAGDGAVYLSSGYKLLAYDSAHGTLRWQAEVPPELPRNDDGTMHVPVVRGGLATTVVGGLDLGNGIMALDTATGRVRWSYIEPGRTDLTWQAIPGDRRVFATNGVVIYGFTA